MTAPQTCSISERTLYRPHSLLVGLAAGLSLALALVGCGASPTVGGGYNATTPTNLFDEAIFDRLDSKVVVIANVNLGAPSRNYLKKREAFIDSRVQEYLESLSLIHI